jgi:hypothetical protein
MVLHTATHLFDQGEFGRALRDLDDLAQLFRHFGREPGFWPALLERAAELDLRRPLFYGLRYTSAVLGTPVPESVLHSDLLRPPNLALRNFMDFHFRSALRPDHPGCHGAWSRVAIWLLYVRGHALLMPLKILIPHLVRKAYMRRLKKDG